MQRLDKKYVWLFFIQSTFGFLVFGLIMFLSFILPIMSGFSQSSKNASNAGAAGLYFFLGVVVVGIIVAIISYIFAKLTYHNYFYELKEDGFYKESGVITKRYVTIPYERIQNVDINRGLFSRFLGLSDLHIQTAGMSGGSYGKYSAQMSEGRLPGISKNKAVEIRDELIRRAKGVKGNSGM